jgi:hypothetical protein
MYLLEFNCLIVGSLEQSPRLVDPYCDPETCAVTSESLIKENLAEAMMENCSIVSRENGKGTYSRDSSSLSITK